MKRLVLFLAIGSAYLWISACGNQQNNADNMDNTDSEWMDDSLDTLGSPRTGLDHDDSMRIDSLQDSLLLVDPKI